MVRSFDVIRTMPVGNFWLALLLMLLTFVLAASSYSFLVFRRAPLKELLLIELAASCVNRLVPSGLGGLGLHGLYLHRRSHTTAQATAIVSINNLLGMIIHMSLLAGVVLTGSVRGLQLGWSIKQGWIAAGIGLVPVLLILMPRVRVLVLRFLRNVLHSLLHYRREPHRLVYAGLALLSLTLLHVSILYLASVGIGVQLDVVALFVVYSMGVLVGAVVPTPGGLAGVEAGLVGGFMAYGVSSTTAIAIALAFRFVTYWLPILPGALALYVVNRKQLLTRITVA